MATGFTWLHRGCVASINCDIPRQSIDNYLSGKQTDFPKNQAHRIVLSLHLRQNCGWDDPKQIVPHQQDNC